MNDWGKKTFLPLLLVMGFPAHFSACSEMTASRAKLSLIPARSPPGPQCQIKHLTGVPVPLSRQKDIWRLKLGNWEDDGWFLCGLSNVGLNISIFPCLPSTDTFSPICFLHEDVCVCGFIFLLMFCQMWMLSAQDDKCSWKRGCLDQKVAVKYLMSFDSKGRGWWWSLVKCYCSGAMFTISLLKS